MKGDKKGAVCVWKAAKKGGTNAKNDDKKIKQYLKACK